MVKILFVIFFTTLVGLLSNIVATWIEPLASTRKKFIIITFILLSLIVGIYTSEEGKEIDDFFKKKQSHNTRRNIDSIKRDSQVANISVSPRSFTPKNNKAIIQEAERKASYLPQGIIFSIKENFPPQFILDFDSRIQDIKFIANTNYFITKTSGTDNIFQEDIPGSIDIWNSETGLIHKNVLKTDYTILNSMSLPSNGKYLYSYIKNLQLNCIDISNGNILKSYPLKFPNYSFEPVLISRDGNLLIYSTHEDLSVYNNITNKKKFTFSWLNRRLNDVEFMRSLALSPDSKIIAVGSVWGSIYLLNSEKGNLLNGLSSLENYKNNGEISDIFFLNNKYEFITAGNKLQRWQFSSKITLLQTYDCQNCSFASAILEKFDIIAVSDKEGNIIFLRLSTGERIGILRNNLPIINLSFSNSGEYLIVTGNKQIKVWNIKSFYQMNNHFSDQSK